MGTRRNTLLVVFNEQNVEDVISCLVRNGDPNEFTTSKIDKDFYKAAYTNVSTAFTEDQALSAFHITEDRWSKMPENQDENFSYCPRDNIFNILLHFSTVVLGERNWEPICKFEHLLKWHAVTYIIGEDILTTSYLASKDVKTRFSRKSFSWPVVIDHDSALLGLLCSKRMADIHNHLGGNGYVSELNWLSLMNDVSSRREQFNSDNFKISKALRSSYGTENRYISLYSKVIKAAAVRLFLFDAALHDNGCKSVEERNNNFKEKCVSDALLDCDTLCGLLQQKSSLGVDMYLSDITSAIATAQRMYGNSYQTCSKTRVYVDYALLRQADFQLSNPCSNINFVLSGERWLLYRIFSKIYRGEDKSNRLSMLLYIYLLIKNEFQNEFVQTNPIVGFGNFKEYQDRKSAFLKPNSVYETLLVQTSIRSIINGKKNRYLETRIAPKDSSAGISQSIRYYDSSADYINLRNNRRFPSFQASTNKWHYVTHFIKSEDKQIDRLKKGGGNPLQNPRNWNVRQSVRRQSQAINSLRQYNQKIAKRIVGIDAASFELCCRPEVFAQGFRFLRNSMHCRTFDQKPLSDLGITYHVGEDFNDIIDGLRAVKEAELFLEMRNGDRIGHGLVLGTDVEKYYARRDFSVPMSKQCILDNMAFMLIEGSTLEGFNQISTRIQQHFERLLIEIYGEKLYGKTITPYTYYQSWLLRGDAPEYYSDCRISESCFDKFHLTNQYCNKCQNNPNNKLTDKIENGLPWQRCAKVYGDMFDDARKNKYACYLYHLYHFNKDVKRKGYEFEQLEYPKEAIPVIARLQEKILTEIETKCISIECNPSSNFKIGEIERFIEHPVSRFNMIARPKYGQMHNISVSINTDDKGVFSTSLEREFALIAAAYDKEFKHDSENSPTPREVYNWLDNIREMAFEMAFAKKNLG